MPEASRFHRGTAMSAALFALAYFACARAGLSLVAQPESIASLWPASGLALAWLTLSPRRRWPALVGALVVANLAANALAGVGPAPSAGFALANALEAVVAAVVVTTITGGRIDSHSHRPIVALLAAAGPGNALTALAGAAVAVSAFDAPFWGAYRLWWIADGLGMLAAGALVLFVTSAGGCVGWRRRPHALVLLLALSVTAIMIFHAPAAEPPRLLALPYAAILLTIAIALTATPRAVAVALMIVTVAAASGTVAGRGPFARLSDGRGEQVLELQAFLAALIVVTLLIAAEVATRRATTSSLLGRGMRSRRCPSTPPT